VLATCDKFTTPDGKSSPITPEKRRELEDLIISMADGALRTLCLAHSNYESASALGEGWETKGPEASSMILDAIVGIMDPLRPDVKDAVATAQKAGVMV
ncbi:unnamed protein product, partial [Discosporangium mesarthrocarpum]